MVLGPMSSWVIVDDDLSTPVFNYAAPAGMETFGWGDAAGGSLVTLPMGAYAVVRCCGENSFRALSCEPAEFGRASVVSQKGGQSICQLIVKSINHFTICFGCLHLPFQSKQ